MQYDVMKRVRLPLIILVTYAHSYGAIQKGYSLLTSGWDTYEVLKLLVSQTLVKVAVPAFFVMSGYLFFSNIETFTKEVFWQKIRRRVKTLLMPYIVWNIMMAVKLKTFSLDMFVTPANMPLWFLRDLMIVTLLTPIIYIVIKKLGWWVVAILAPIYLTGIFAIQPGPNPYAICFFTIGAVLSIKRLDLVETCMRYSMLAFAASVILAVAMIVSYGTEWYMILMLWFRVTSVVGLFGLMGRRAHLGQTHVWGEASYFVYLSHYVLFFGFIDDGFFWLFGDSTFSLCAHYLLCPLVKAAILVAIYCTYRRISHKFCRYPK